MNNGRRDRGSEEERDREREEEESGVMGVC